MSNRNVVVRPAKLVEKYGEDFPVWSYSRLSSFNNCQHEFYLSRLLKKENLENIYGILGGSAHDVLEDFYNGKIKYEDMLDRFENKFLDVEISDIKFSSDEDKNKRMMEKYKSCIVHFFKHHKPVTSKVICEQEIWVDVRNSVGEGGVFIGYVDAIHKEGEYYVITDYKTSSMGAEYKGEHLLEKQKQLLLYALALIQKGVPADKIKIRWNFLKYTNIRYNHMINVTYLKGDKYTTSCVKKSELIAKIATQLKKDMLEHDPNTNTKEVTATIKQWKVDNDFTALPEWLQKRYVLSDVVKTAERYKWVESVKTQLKKDLKEYGLTDIEIELQYTDCVVDNNLESLPEEVKANYILEDAYVYGTMNQQNIDNLVEDMIANIIQINDNGTDESKWTSNKLKSEPGSFYCNNLCGVRNDCKYYKEFLEQLKAEQYVKEDIDILTELENL